jgi:hypothetical protein
MKKYEKKQQSEARRRAATGRILKLPRVGTIEFEDLNPVVAAEMRRPLLRLSTHN